MKCARLFVFDDYVLKPRMKCELVSNDDSNIRLSNELFSRSMFDLIVRMLFYRALFVILVQWHRSIES